MELFAFSASGLCAHWCEQLQVNEPPAYQSWFVDSKRAVRQTSSVELKKRDFSASLRLYKKITDSSIVAVLCVRPSPPCFVLAGVCVCVCVCVETGAHSAKATTGGGNIRNVTHPVDGPHCIVYIVFLCVCVCVCGRGVCDRWRISGVCVHIVSLLECVGCGSEDF